jgi:hypothetical protein
MNNIYPLKVPLNNFIGVIFWQKSIIFYICKTEEGATMNEGTRNRLEAKLKKMLDLFDQAKTKKRTPITQSGIGNIIRRRSGKEDKRFSIGTESGLYTAARDNER